jgi:CysZ protein
MRRLIQGALYPFYAFGLLAHTPRLWRYVLLPILVNIVVGATLYIGLLLAGLRVIDGFVAGLPTWAVALGALLRVLLIVILLIATGFVLVRFGVVLGSPWYTRLSGELEQLRGAPALPDQGTGLPAALRDLSRALAFELRKLLLVLAIGALLLLLNFIPVIGQVLATAGWIALGATITCLDFFDYPLERRLLRFRDKLGVIRRSFPASAGFGLVCLGLVSIPLVNLLSIPLCVAAGTLFICDRVDLGKSRA